MSDEQFISEPITPAPGTFDRRGMARGEPGLPARFTWRGDEYTIADVLETWVTSGKEKGGDEIYLRRHWWQIRTTDGSVMKLYCERQKQRRDTKQRWFIYSMG